jgi:hypothetical protein
MEHIYEQHPCFDQADIILIERQPIVGGIVVIEQLIFGKYRHKAKLINPVNVHKFLGIRHLNYDNRKIFSVKFGKQYLDSKLLTDLDSYERQHDITDAIEMLIYWTNKHHNELVQEEYKQSQHKQYKNVFDKLESFRYNGPINLVVHPRELL